MIVKFYDKLLDLVAREGTHQVGSRMATVLGSSHKLNVFNKRLSRSQYTGLSRLEVSISEEALMKFRIWQPSVKTLWHKKIETALKLILDHVFNNEQVLKQCYRRLSVSHLLGHIGRCKESILAVGSKNSWLIIARTSHKRHFIGTRHSIGLSSPRQDQSCLAGWTTSSCDMLHQDPKSMCTGCTPRMAQSSMFVALIR